MTSFLDNFDKFVEDHPEYAGTAPSEAFYVGSTNPAVDNLPADVAMKINDADIFEALLFFTGTEWVQVPASVNAQGNLAFTLNNLGTYVVLSTAA